MCMIYRWCFVCRMFVVFVFCLASRLSVLCCPVCSSGQTTAARGKAADNAQPSPTLSNKRPSPADTSEEEDPKDAEAKKVAKLEGEDVWNGLKVWMFDKVETANEAEEDEDSDDVEDNNFDDNSQDSDKLPSVRRVTIDLEKRRDEVEDSDTIERRNRKLDRTHELFDGGEYEDSLEAYRKAVAGKEEEACVEMGSGNVVRSMMQAVRAYGMTTY